MEYVKSGELKFKYEAYGLKIHSEICLPELKPLKSKDPDVTIRIGEVRFDSQNVQYKSPSFIVSKNAIYRYWDVIGKFKITKKSIIIAPNFKIDEKIIRNYLLGTIFATLLRLRSLFVLHASSININGCAVAFTGFKGFGKSTTALAFYKKGYSIVSDDYIYVQFREKNIPYVTPGFPSLRLTNITRESMGVSPDNVIDENYFIDKTYFGVSDNFSNEPLPLKKIYILHRGHQFKIVNLNTKNSFIELIKNTYGIDFFSKDELPLNFYQCEKLVNSIAIAKLEISDDLKELINVVALIEQDIKE